MQRHRLIMSVLMMRAQIGVQKSTGKIRGNWGRQKGVFLEGSAERAKMGEWVGARRRAWSEKIFHGHGFGVLEWNGLNFKRTNF